MEPVHVPAWAQADPEWAAPLHLLTSPALRTKGCLRAVDFKSREIDFPGLAGANAASLYRLSACRMNAKRFSACCERSGN